MAKMQVKLFFYNRDTNEICTMSMLKLLLGFSLTFLLLHKSTSWVSILISFDLRETTCLYHISFNQLLNIFSYLGKSYFQMLIINAIYSINHYHFHCTLYQKVAFKPKYSFLIYRWCNMLCCIESLTVFWLTYFSS